MSKTDIEQLIRNEFPLVDGLIYLNHAAVSPWPARTAEAVYRFANENTFTGAKNYPAWLAHEKKLRKQVQDLIHAPDIDDIALLKNTSEALSVVAEGIAWNTGDNIVTTDEEFPSNRIVWEAQQRHGVTLKEINVRDNENPEQALMNQCDAKTRVMAVSSVQFASGIRLDLELLGKFCRDQDILFCVDAIQSIGAIPMDVQAIQADFVMADGHKWMLGPEGLALFYCREKVRHELQLHQFGWHMVEHSGDYDRKDWEPAASARRFECGSPNMLGIYALSASLSLLQEVGIDRIEQRIHVLVDLLFELFSKTAGVSIITPEPRERRAGIFTMKFANHDMQELHKELINHQVICAYRGGGIRFSPHFYNSTENIYKLDDIISLYT